MPDLVVLRPEGLYCPAGDFHIDPWRPVSRAVITHGHSDHARVGMGEYHAAAPGLPILRWRLGEQAYCPHEYGEVFTLGDAQVSLAGEQYPTWMLPINQYYNLSSIIAVLGSGAGAQPFRWRLWACLYPRRAWHACACKRRGRCRFGELRGRLGGKCL